MGYTNWSDDDYRARADYRNSTGKSAFDYSDRVVKDTGIRKCHDDMNPKGVIRESRDSSEHPDSKAIMIMLDITGSMGYIPRTLQANLPKLMGMLVRKGFLQDPQVCFGAVGDAYCDNAPLQVGQFEAGLEMDDDLGKIFLEGGGGGQNTETYELGMYFASRKTSIDCYEKRDERGYLFIIADERPYNMVNSHQVASIIGDNLEADIPLESMVDELIEKWDTYILMPENGGAHKHDKTIKSKWEEYFPQRVLEFNPENVSEVIASIIAASEGFSEGEIHSGLDDVGAATAKAAVSRALAPLGARSVSSVTGGKLLKSNRKGNLEAL